MDSCSIESYSKYQALKKMSGINKFFLQRFAIGYYNEYGVFPELDLIPNANSTNALIEGIKLNKKNVTKIENILQYIGETDINRAMHKINDLHRDLETVILPLNEEAFVYSTRRPSAYYINEHGLEINPSLSSRSKSKSVITQMLLRLLQYYGINIINTNTEEIKQKFGDLIPDAQISSAFVLNGDIYINTDIADVDAPIHELMHIFIGGIKFQEPLLYYELVNSIETIPNYQVIASRYIGRTKSDINEEVFVEEFSKYLTNQNSFIPNLGNKIIDRIFYNMTRIIDSSLMGRYSAQSIPQEQLTWKSIDDLATILESEITTPQYLGTLDNAGVNRKLANMKELMMKNNDLIEKCE